MEQKFMLKQHFVKQAIKEAELEKFITESFPEGDYSKIVLQRTPLGLKVVIYTNKPGRIIGRGGRNIELINQALKNKFGLENPQIDIKAVENPDLDAKIVAKQIASALERGYNYKKIGNVFLKRIMDAGAIGVEIIIAGKLGGAMSRMGKFIAGYIKHSG
ncbi:MAG TPA: 30S ribosomal protein S3, partial [archaeon]|nr:30S ribosomal protein S3 [archaeon]